MSPNRPGESASEGPLSTGPPALYGAVLTQDRQRVCERLRRQWGSVAPAEIAPGVAAWLLLGHQEVLESIWKEQLFSSDPRHWRELNDGLLPPGSALLPMLGRRPAVSRLDGQEHRLQRQALTATLDRIELRLLRRLVQQQAGALVDGWAVHGTADLMTQFARPLVWRVFTRLLGLSDGSSTSLDSWVTTIVAGAPGAEDADAELLEAVRRVLTDRRVTPGPDLPSWLAHTSRLTADEIAHNMVALLLAGAESTISWIGNTVRLLLTDARLSAALADGRLTVADALDHTLWAGSPVPAIAGRWATADFTFAGRRIRAGDLLVPCPAAANTDPEFHGARTAGNRAHLAWGTGTHGCPAKDPARVIAETAVDVLLGRLTGICLKDPGSPLRWRPSLWCGAPSEIQVVFSGAASAAVGLTEPLTVMAVPEKKQDDSAAEHQAPHRWGWWDSMAGG